MEEQVRFPNQFGEQLSGALQRPDDFTGRGVVMGHCFTCSKHTRILIELSQALAEAGFMALRFDFSGNGQSQGDFAESAYSKHIEEMLTAVANLRKRGARWIGLAGHSMGAAIALLTAAVSGDARAVCTLAGRYTGLRAERLLDDLQRRDPKIPGRIAFTSRGRQLELAPRFFQDAERYDLPGSVHGLNLPLLIVHGDGDEVIPVSEALAGRDLKPAGTTLSIIKGADHMFSKSVHRRVITRQVVDWFKELDRQPIQR